LRNEIKIFARESGPSTRTYAATRSLSSLTESAYHLYRERFLVMRYGPNVIVPVRKAKTSDKPADDEKPKAAVDGGSLSS